MANFVIPGTPASVNQTLIASAAKTSTFSSDSFTGLERFTNAVLMLNCTAASGTSPTLNVYWQRLLPDNTTWQDVGSFTQVTAAADIVMHIVTGASSCAAVTTSTLAAGTVKAISLGNKCRLRCVIGGTNPSFTFSVFGDFAE